MGSSTGSGTGPRTGPGTGLGTVTPLRRGSTRTRELLLGAAGRLFAERGYDRTTLRDLGELAGVDPAMVARHFGSKAGLYLTVLRAELGDDVPADLLQPGRLPGLLERLRRRGAGPVVQAAVHAHEDEQVQRAAGDELRARLVGPLRERFAGAGLDRAALRAEVGVAALAGVLLARGAGTLEELAGASDADLTELVTALLRALDDPRG